MTDRRSTSEYTDTPGYTEEDLQELVAKSDTGARVPSGLPGKLLVWTAVAWSLFQLWYASPLPFMVGMFILNDTEARSIHLAFALFLAFTAYPATSKSPNDRVPLTDWVFAALGAVAGGYLFWAYEALAMRPGLPTTTDLAVAILGIILLLEATRRTLGPALMIVAMVFLFYTFAGPYMPVVISHKGSSLSRVMSHQWLTTEGVFGIALGVSTSFVFLFVLFGSLLEKAGAGNYFIKLAFAMLGHLRGGPAKAAVLSSGLTGVISGSSIANVVTTGTFTIPLMRRVGFKAEKAGAVEVAASVNGQIMPPVMGAAAFLMVEYVGISYTEVIKHAFLPAVISYIALLYIVHLEAVKAGMQGLPRAAGRERTIFQAIMGFALTAVGFVVLSGLVYYGIGWIKTVFGSQAAWVVAVLSLAVYLGLLYLAARSPELTVDDPRSPVTEMPEVGPTARAGFYYLLPVVVLIWCLMIERLSPGLSAFWATAALMAIVLTQRPILTFFRGRHAFGAEIKAGVHDLFQGLELGARNMIGIGIATATAGIVVGTVSLTGIGLVMTEFVEFISGGNLVLMLALTAFISLVLGMGLPTTANYIVVSTLMAPVIVTLGAQSGLIVPLIAVHLFVFYFGIMADVTPPVGLASFAAAAISGGDPLRTGVQAFFYSMRTAILPFLFIFNTQLLLIGIDTWWHLFLTVSSAVVAMLVFAAGTMGWFLARSRLWESAALLLVAFTLLRPGFFWDFVYPPYEDHDPKRIEDVVATLPPEATVRVRVQGEDFTGKAFETSVILPLGPVKSGPERLEFAGIQVVVDEEGRTVIDDVVFGSPAEKLGLDFDWAITAVRVESQRPWKEWVFVPALILLGLVSLFQWRRRVRSATA